ncbi:hypothetical protein B2A_05078 [mine drainage metagenome]|uniref:Uncharacterized protein n=1 Tax=mine drainage metagenome TaxID=410659 RepID=T1AHV0_9ZZZZ
MPADARGHGQHVTQIGTAVLIRWRANGNEQCLAVHDASAGIGGETQQTRGVVALHHRRQTRLEDRQHALLQRGDLVGVNIHAQNMITHLGQTGARDQANIAGAEKSDAHVRARVEEAGILAAAHGAACGNELQEKRRGATGAPRHHNDDNSRITCCHPEPPVPDRQPVAA